MLLITDLISKYQNKKVFKGPYLTYFLKPNSLALQKTAHLTLWLWLVSVGGANNWQWVWSLTWES